MMATMDEWQSLSTLRTASSLPRSKRRNILDEPIPEAVNKRPLKPLLPRPIPPPRKRKVEKRRAILQEFDPLYAATKRKFGVKRGDLLPLIAAKQNLTDPPLFVLQNEADIVKDYRAAVPLGHLLEGDCLTFLEAMTPSTMELIEKELNRLGGVKFSLILTTSLEQVYDDNAESNRILTTAYFRSDVLTVVNRGSIAQNLTEAKAQIIKSLEEFTNEGSGWRHKRCVTLDMGIAQYRPFRGRSYIKTPAYIPPRTVINVKNNDNRCFEWATISAMCPAHEHQDRTTHYRAHLGKLNFKGITFPVKVTDVSKFEQLNPGLSVSVFGWENGLYPLYVSKQEGHAIDLLLIVDKEDPEKTHYVWIKDLARMLYKNSNYKGRKHPCRRCLHVFSSEALLSSHTSDCQGIGEKPQRTVVPEEGKNILKFTNHHKQMRVPFIIYADFEALHIPVDSCENNPENSYTREIAKQTPCSYCYVVVRYDGVARDPVLYRGENAVEHFLENLQTELKEINEVFHKPAKMYMTLEDRESFRKANDCHICGKILGNDRVRDHCHITGKYRGAAHNACNLQLRISAWGDTYITKDGKVKKKRGTKVPVVFHNLRGYDGYLIMSALRTSAAIEGQKISCIPNNMEKYMTFSVGQLQFIDSLQFMNASLEKLAANVPTENLAITSAGLTNAELALLRRKGVYPYEYINSFYQFNEQQLPPKDAFYSQLNREHISDEDYQHAQCVWDTFNCKTFGDYHDIYLRTDVLLLADVFETFRKTSMQHYGLDPANYFSAPGMSWDALMKKLVWSSSS